MRRSIAVTVILLFSAACGANPKQADQNPIDNIESETNAMPNKLSLDQQVDAALNDLAGRIGANKSQISLAEKRVVSWRNGALGCPEPGKYYTQALVTGSLIRLSVNGATYQYHAAQGGQPLLCPKKRIQSPASGEGLSDI